MAATYGKGFSAQAEIIPEIAYGTLASTGTEKGLRLLSESLRHDITPVMSEIRSNPGAARLASVMDMQRAGGTVVVEADYHNVHELILAALGTYAAGPPKVYTPAAENTTMYSIVVDRGPKRFQFTGGMIEEIRIIGDSSDGRIRIETDWIFQKCTPSDTAIHGEGLVTSTKMKMSEMTFRIGDTADALAAADALPISSFTFRLKNNYKVDFASGSAYMIQPIRDTQREVSFSFTAPRYSDEAEIAAIETAAAAHTILQADMKFDGPSTSTFDLYLPEMRVTPVPAANITGFNTMTYSADFNCFKNLVNTTYMATSANLECLINMIVA